MKFKVSLIIFSVVLISSCKSKRKDSNDLSKRAFNMFYIDCKYDRTVCADSALLLFNKAIELDNENFSAFDNKIGVLTEQKDIVSLLETSNRLIELRPNKPSYRLQRGVFLLIKGEKIKGDLILKEALNEYKNLLNGDLSDFNLNLEYINALNINDRFDEARAHLELMKNENYLESQIQFLEFYKIEVNPKAKMIEYFNSDKTIEDIFE